MYLIISIIIIIILIISFIYYNINIKETFEVVQEYNDQLERNDKRVLFTYKPQLDVHDLSYDKYWKDFPLASNNELVQESPIYMKNDNWVLPVEKQFGNNNYERGFLNFPLIIPYINDKEPIDKKAVLLYVHPVTHQKLKFAYELNYALYEINSKTNIDRKNYNPLITQNFDTIICSIPDINRINDEFLLRFNKYQVHMMNQNEILYFGKVPFNIWKYKIVRVEYIEGDINKPLYTLIYTLYKYSDLYMHIFSIQGYIENNETNETIVKIMNTEYIGGSSKDNHVLNEPYNKNEIKQLIINKNFSNESIIEKDPSAILNIMKIQKEAYDIKNQYACFPVNSDNVSADSILFYNTKTECEAVFDVYGRPKPIGIFDKPCKKNEECPFYKKNKNYSNEFGKCMENGYCELPVNMEPIGYHYYKVGYKPMCYNCNTKRFQYFTNMDTCCDEQNNKENYPFLTSPDYAFEDDNLERYNLEIQASM